MDNIIASATAGAQFIVFGDTYHGVVPMWPVYESMDAMRGLGQEYYFIEQHYSLQPAIEQLRVGAISEDKFREICSDYNSDDFWGHSEVADSIIAANNAGLRVVAFDTRSAEELGLDSVRPPPNQIEGYPSDLLPSVQRGYDRRNEESFDGRSADIVSEISGESRGIVWIGNRHIHGGHADGDTQDFDGHLGVERTARVAVYYSMEDYEAYVGREGLATRDLKCVQEDQPDFMYIVDEGIEIATASAVTKGYDVSNIVAADIPAACYTPEESRLLSTPTPVMPTP